MNIIELTDVSKTYKRNVKALKQFSLSVQEGECVGVIGESGSGKSTLAKLLVGLERKDQGNLSILGSTVSLQNKKEKAYFRQRVQMVFQDATSVLNPKMPIWKSVIEPLENFKKLKPRDLDKSRDSALEIAKVLLNMVGLDQQYLQAFPDDLSGGQKQRVGIARAISLSPKLLICDEPTSSLDVTVQKQILLLLKELQQKKQMSIVFISHDIRAVVFICERIIVLKDGEKVDEFLIDDIYSNERHPYTKTLIKAASYE
jgi:ABC-type dipeptide/oligopeptide/nickel transport system ATPase subunit